MKYIAPCLAGYAFGIGIHLISEKTGNDAGWMFFCFALGIFYMLLVIILSLFLDKDIENY